MSPTAALRCCLQPGCPARVTRGYCPQHAKARRAESNALNRERRVEHDPRNTQRWKRWRAQILRERPVCQRCNEALSTSVHHQGGGGTDPVLCFDLARLVALCDRCHRQLEAEERRG